MKAAVVHAAGKPPVFDDFSEPTGADGDLAVRVTAAAISQLVKARASGAHYSSRGVFPFIAGVDGVGRLDDGSKVYFILPGAPYGTMAERAVVPPAQIVRLPDDLDDVTAAAIANPGMSSWAAYTERAGLKAGETVLVNGATGTSGRLAVQIARHLGAGKVIATGRNPQALEALRSMGADQVIRIGEDADVLEKEFVQAFSGGVDVVIDYLWGVSAERLLVAAAKNAEEAKAIRFVQVGSVSSQTISLPSAVLRSSAIEMMGSGLGSIPFDRLLASINGVFAAAIPAGLKIDTQTMPLSDVEKAWSVNDSVRRMVLTI